MALSNEMRRLTKGFPAAYDDRVAMVATIRKDTAQELSGFRAAHQSMAAEQHRHLADYVCGLRDNITKMLASLDTAHQSMAVDQRQRLTDYVYRLHDNVTSMMASLDTAHQSMAAKQRQGLHDDVTSMMASLDTAHQSMAADQRQRLVDHVHSLRHNVGKMLESLDVAHQRMAAKQQKRLAAGRAHLASDVSKMRGRLHADHSKACKIWNDFAIVMTERRAKKSGAPSPKAQTAKAEKPAPRAAGTAIADDLTTIKGLGAGRQLSLNKMGIHTFAQLAKSVPQKIRKALGASGPLANVEEWIKEARKHCK